MCVHIMTNKLVNIICSFKNKQAAAPPFFVFSQLQKIEFFAIILSQSPMYINREK